MLGAALGYAGYPAQETRVKSAFKTARGILAGEPGLESETECHESKADIFASQAL